VARHPPRPRKRWVASPERKPRQLPSSGRLYAPPNRRPIRQIGVSLKEARQQPWAELLDYARWAPSPHNTQPWKIKALSGGEAELYYDPKRLLTVEDGDYRFFFVAIGIFCESLKIAARGQGLEIVVDYVTDQITGDAGEPQLLANLSLRPSTTQEPLDPELIKARRTSRLHYDGNPLSELALSELAAEAERFGHEFKHSSDGDFIKWVLELDKETLFDDLQDRATREEITSWFRFSAAEAEKNPDGLWSECFGFPGWLLRFFLNRTYLLELPVVKQATMAYYSRSMTGVATVGWLAGPFLKTADWVSAGHMLARFWLVLTKHGGCLHPFGSVITNLRSHHQMAERLAESEEGDRFVWLLLRLGYSQEPPRSKRLAVADLLMAVEDQPRSSIQVEQFA